jgi:acyl-CoA reductase-like NAD-dependent aldehyde dehydrogenase
MTDLDPFLGDFQFVDFGFQNPVVEHPMPNLQHPRPHSYPVPPAYTSPVSAAVSPVSPHFDISAGKKRKLENFDPNSQQAIDEAARIAAEEDKRRRNTAASARFRVKKKQREQALEKTAKEMTERVSVLESRISQLEMENNWLKSLITEKNEKTTPDISAMYKKFTEENAGERSTGGRTDGVGTQQGKPEKAEA